MKKEAEKELNAIKITGTRSPLSYPRGDNSSRSAARRLLCRLCISSTLVDLDSPSPLKPRENCKAPCNVMYKHVKPTKRVDVPQALNQPLRVSV
jgi:hypothetical protein